jgi:hypothetical protein
MSKHIVVATVERRRGRWRDKFEEDVNTVMPPHPLIQYPWFTAAQKRTIGKLRK